MRLPKNLGTLLLGIWLVLFGLISLGILRFGALDTIAALLAIAAGILLLLRR